MRELTIDGTLINDESDCYVIAEIGHNHQGDLKQCEKLFLAAKEAGANAVKLQKRDNRTLYSPEMYASPYTGRDSYGRTYGEHREALEFSRADYEALQFYAAGIGITFFATAFDIPSADFLADLHMPAIKIASGDLTNPPLLDHIAQIGMPVILSTGGGSELDLEAAHMGFAGPLAILQCTSGYPAAYDELNLSVIKTYRKYYHRNVIGYSGHDNGIAMAVVAYALGARIIEKHFTFDRSAKGTDHAFSLEPQGLAKMVRDLRRAKLAMGDGIKRRYDSENEPLLKQEKNWMGKVDGLPKLRVAA